MKIVKAIIVVIAIVGLGGYFLYTQNQRTAINEFNRLQALVNEQKITEAAAGYEKLLQTAPADIQAKVKEELAACYMTIADDPSQPLKETARLYRRVHELAPEKLSATQNKTMHFGE